MPPSLTPASLDLLSPRRAVRRPGDDARQDAANRMRPVALWLFVVCAMLLVMIVLGGTTRLTVSGLSIMEWAPIDGVLPPMTQADWQRLFALYQKIPQYALVNAGFGIEGFKHIFWLEWTHRLWGRLIGLVFFVPLVWFWWTGRVDRKLQWRLASLFVLGGLQGLVGWFMVASGFEADSTAVSPYRLVLHLALALALYGVLLWTALSILRPSQAAPDRLRGLRRWCMALAALVALTIVAGGFVAGLHAGLIYNTFPLMDGHLVPTGYAALTPLARNPTENIAAVQFDHRVLATLTVCLAMFVIVRGLATEVAARTRLALFAVLALVLLQYALGIATLVNMVPIPLAASHQASAALLLSAVLILLHSLRADRAP